MWDEYRKEEVESERACRRQKFRGQMTVISVVRSGGTLETYWRKNQGNVLMDYLCSCERKRGLENSPSLHTWTLPYQPGFLIASDSSPIQTSLSWKQINKQTWSHTEKIRSKASSTGAFFLSDSHPFLFLVSFFLSEWFFHAAGTCLRHLWPITLNHLYLEINFLVLPRSKPFLKEIHLLTQRYDLKLSGQFLPTTLNQKLPEEPEDRAPKNIDQLKSYRIFCLWLNIWGRRGVVDFSYLYRPRITRMRSIRHQYWDGRWG